MSTIRRVAVLTAGALFAAGAQAELLLSTSFSGNFPFGPFKPNEKIEIVVSLTNVSPDKTITICEGPCIGDSLTYSLGGLASIPTGYSFYFGDKKAEDVFDGQIEGELLPGQEKDFIFGVYDPDGQVEPGWYSFRTQLQIFDATADRVMLTSPTFSGQWEVKSVPEPGTLAVLSISLGGLAFTRRRKNSRGCFPVKAYIHRTITFLAAALIAGLVSLPPVEAAVIYDSGYSVQAVYESTGRPSGLAFGPGRSITYSSFYPDSTSGIYRIAPSGTQNYISSAAGASVVRDQSGTMFLSGRNESQGVLKVRPNGDSSPLVSSGTFYDLALSSDGSRLIASTLTAIWEINTATGAMTQLLSRPSDIVLSLAISETGEVFFTSYTGLYQLTSSGPSLVVSSPRQDGVIVNAFFDLALDPLGGMWMVTAYGAGDGLLYHFDAASGLDLIADFDAGEAFIAFDQRSGYLALGGQLAGDGSNPPPASNPITLLRTPFSVPEPGTLALLGLSLTGLVAARWRRS